MKATPIEIQGHLRIKGTNQARLARDLHLTPSWISMVVNGRGKSRKVQDFITEILGFNPWAVAEGGDNGTN